MKHYFHGKTVLLGRACGGFETELARQLMGAGARLVLTDRDARALAHTVRDLTPYAAEGGGEVLSSFSCDLRAPGGGLAAWRTCAKITGTVDMVILTAGAAGGLASPGTGTEELGARVREELLAPSQILALLLRDMTARRSGHIVLISPAHGRLRPSGAQVKLCDTIRHDLSGYGIAVSCVHRHFREFPSLNGKKGKSTGPYGGRNKGGRWRREARRTLKGIARGRRNIRPGIRARLAALAAPFSHS